MEGVFPLLALVATFAGCEAGKDGYYPRYHLAPPHGWMNDPNGFSFFKDEYQLFYQYNPNSSLEAGIAHWGHAKSPNLVHWEHLPIALYPDQPYDIDGVFLGSAIVKDDIFYVIYTGNVNRDGESPDKEQRQALATSLDGITFEKYAHNPIIEGDSLQPNFRDPKVWKHLDTYYMVTGNAYEADTLGRALLFTSKDLYTWQEAAVLSEALVAATDGYMWECPDFFELGGKFVLLCNPQGILPDGDHFRNLYQSGYVIGDFDYNTKVFTPLTKFKQIDRGHDFYATQTTLDSDGRRILIAWCDMWEQYYPERADGFTGHMTVPRVLTLGPNYEIIQTPIEELQDVRGDVLHSGKATSSSFSVTLEDNAAEVDIWAPLKDFEFLIVSTGVSQTPNTTKVVKITYDLQSKHISLDRGGKDGVRTVKWKPPGDLKLKILIDASSIELFCGSGEVTFSSRFFPRGAVGLQLGANSKATELNVVAMKRAVRYPAGAVRLFPILFPSLSRIMHLGHLRY